MRTSEQQKDLERVRRMIRACEEVIAYTEDVSHADFLDDRILQLAISKLIEHAAESARTFSKTFREQYDAYPWQDVVDMRNILAHEYWRIDPDAVYEVSLNDIPELLGYLLEIKINMEQQDFS